MKDLSNVGRKYENMKIAIGRASNKKRLEIFQNRNITNILLYLSNRE